MKVLFNDSNYEAILVYPLWNIYVRKWVRYFFYTRESLLYLFYSNVYAKYNDNVLDLEQRTRSVF